MTGVYVLLYRKKVVYIGQTRKWPNRLFQHKLVKFDEARLIECKIDDLRYFESRLIRIFKPKFNVSESSKTRKRRITDEWIVENNLSIGGCKNRDEVTKIAEKAKSLLGYSPMYNASDLGLTIIRAYCRIYDMEWNYKKGRFRPKKVYQKIQGT